MKLGLITWIKIFTSPKQTIDEIVSFSPRFGIIPLSFIPGFVFLWELSVRHSFGTYFSLCQLLLAIVIVSPIIGYIILSFLSYLAYQAGRFFNSKSGFLRIRAAISWSLLPLIGIIAVDLILLAVFGKRLFTTYPKILSIAECYLCLIALFIKACFCVLSLILLYQTLHVIQKLSKRKVVITIITTFVIFFVVYFLIEMPFKPKYANFFDYPTITSLDIKSLEDMLLF